MLVVIAGYAILSSLVYLDLSYNQLENLSDLRGAQGHPLTYLDVRGNRLASIDGLIQDLSDLKNLKDLIISDEPPSSADNPLCYHAVCLNSKQLTLNHVNAPLILSRMLKQVKCSRGIQAIGDHCSNALRLVSPKKVRHVMLQVGIGSQERRKLISQLDQVYARSFLITALVAFATLFLAYEVSSELQMERSLRRKSEQLHESLLKKTEKLEERSKQEQDLLCENLRLKEELAIEVRSRNLLEKRLQDISRRVEMTVQRFEVLTASTLDYSQVIKEKLAQMEAEMAMRESMWTKSILEAESRIDELTQEEKTVCQRIAKACESGRAQVEAELKAAKDRYAQLEAEFRSALLTESKRYSQMSMRAAAAEEVVQKQSQELIAANEHLNSATATVNNLKKTIVEQQQELQLSDQNLLNAKDLLKNMNKTIKEITTQLSEEVKAKMKLMEEHEECCLMKDRLSEQKETISRLQEENIGLKQQQGDLSNNNAALSVEVSELETKLVSEQDNVRIKSKQIDDQLETIKTLKSELVIVREKIKALETESKALGACKEENKELREVIDRLHDRKDELKGTILQQQNFVFDLQRENKTLKSELTDCQEKAATLVERVASIENDWKSRVEIVERERDEARTKIRTLEELNRDYDERIQQAEGSMQAQLEFVNDRLRETQETARKRIHQLEDEMRLILQDSANSRNTIEKTLKYLTGVLSS
ncbi:unnamed protein product [Mesocestoides corti]|uniref:Uncharacterized protein n=1 Tax=Mesocestoides corti TaxID=53468 RepID=A0A158QUF4_MESCO|nr:unnamed protein product [Mesocestoides corti]